MLDSVSFSAIARQPAAVPAFADELTDPLSAAKRAAASSCRAVGPSRTSPAGCAHADTAAIPAVKPSGDECVTRSPQRHPDLRTAAAKFSSTPTSPQLRVVSHVTASDTATARASRSSGRTIGLAEAKDFANGFGKGVCDGASGMIQGIGGLAKETAARAESRFDATSDALLHGQMRSAGNPPVGLRHVFTGEIGRKRGADAAKGFHHAPDDALHADARVVQVISPRNEHGVYEARVEISRPGTTTVYSKVSTMFPDTMSRDDVVAAIQHAYTNATVASGNRFVGPSGHGFAVEGYTSGTADNVYVRTAYPLYK